MSLSGIPSLFAIVVSVSECLFFCLVFRIWSYFCGSTLFIFRNSRHVTVSTSSTGISRAFATSALSSVDKSWNAVVLSANDLIKLVIGFISAV